MYVYIYMHIYVKVHIKIVYVFIYICIYIYIYIYIVAYRVWIKSCILEAAPLLLREELTLLKTRGCILDIYIYSGQRVKFLQEFTGQIPSQEFVQTSGTSSTGSPQQSPQLTLSKALPSRCPCPQQGDGVAQHLLTRSGPL